MPSSFVEQLFGLQGQTAVVIGGTGVLCGAMAEGLARAGARVVVAGRDPEKGRERVEAIRAFGGDAYFAAVDVSSRDSIRTLLESATAEDGGVDILVNGAGVNKASTYLDADDENWDRILDSNLKAVHRGCQIFGKWWIDNKRPGSIVNIASVTSDKPLSRVFAYSASKAAVVNLTQNVAREFAPHGIRVNALAPGFFPAEQNRAILDAERQQNIMRNTPMGRYGEPDELLGTLLLLASRKAGSFITGSTYYVDGGFTAMRF